MSLPKEIQQLALDLSAQRSDGEVVRRTFGFEIKAGSIDLEKRTVRVIASTDSIDSYDERVEQDWDLKRYKKNPVVLYGHNRVGFLGLGGDPNHTLPIGYATEVKISDGHLEATLNFVDEAANPMAERVWQGFIQKSIRAVSVGFRPHSVHVEKDKDQETVVLSDNELYEISAVPIPANADAVALSTDERRTERAALLARAAAKTNQPVSREPAPAAPKSAPKENSMTDAEIKALQDQLAAKTAELTALQQVLDTEKSAHAKTAAELQTAKSKVEGLEAKSTEQATAIETLTKANKVFEDAAKVAEAAAAEKDVDDLIQLGKLLPASKEKWVKIRARSAEEFKELTDDLPVLPHAKEVVPEGKGPAPGTALSLVDSAKAAA
jgi:HK97 family phage prohead protease